jgi:hypothetical protein
MPNVTVEVEQEVKKVAAAVETAVAPVAKAVKAEVAKVVEKTTQELTDAEKLAIRELENSYLKVQIEINRLSQITQKAQADFTTNVEALIKKYVTPTETWAFDNVQLLFRKK